MFILGERGWVRGELVAAAETRRQCSPPEVGRAPQAPILIVIRVVTEQRLSGIAAGEVALGHARWGPVWSSVLSAVLHLVFSVSVSVSPVTSQDASLAPNAADPQILRQEPSVLSC